jgi:hypothetical protein
MKFIITYSNFKAQQIYTSNIHYTFKSIMTTQLDISENTYQYVKKYTHYNNRICKALNLNKHIEKYSDTNGITNYKIELILQDDNKKKYSDEELLINNICETLFINILESDVIHNKLNIMIDHDKIKLFHKYNVPNIDIDIQIYDTNNIFDEINKIILNLDSYN